MKSEIHCGGCPDNTSKPRRLSTFGNVCATIPTRRSPHPSKMDMKSDVRKSINRLRPRHFPLSPDYHRSFTTWQCSQLCLPLWVSTLTLLLNQGNEFQR